MSANAERSVAEAFPAETRLLASSAACQITAISQRIVMMAGEPEGITQDDLGRTFLRSMAVRVEQLSTVLGALAEEEEFAKPGDELQSICLTVEGVYPQRWVLPDGVRRYYGIPEDSPIGEAVREAVSGA